MRRNHRLYQRRRLARILCACFVMALFALTMWGLERAIVPTLLEISQAQVTMLANEVVSHTITNKVVRLVQYRDLIHFDQDSSGEIVYMQANTMEISRVEMIALSSLQESLRTLEAYRIHIPLGQLTGSRLFATMGPRIPVTIYPLAEVRTAVRDEFDAVGINQTRHNIFLDVDLKMGIVIPLLSTQTTLNNSFLLSSVIIQGRVPSTYVHIHR